MLFICTSEAEFNGRKNGTFLQEIAIPIYELYKAGIELDILSPKGGAIPVYHKFDTTQLLRAAMESQYYIDKTSHSIRMDAWEIDEYEAIVIPGGYGQFLDLHKHDSLKALIVKHYEKGGIIGTLGHGTAMLAQLKLSDGNYLVDGVNMTCFPSWNELNIMEESDKGKLLPFLMQEELSKHGADLKIYDHEKKINHEIIDKENRIVTAAFASGGSFIAASIIQLLEEK